MLANKKFSSFFLMFPTIGILIFIGLYFYAANQYPGGSQANINSTEFDWVNNYWCNLLNEESINGKQNPARPIAILAMLILSGSLLIFFFQFSKHFEESKIWKLIIQVCGTISMVTAIFIFTEYHDQITILASVFGFFVFIGIIRAIYQSDLQLFKMSGLLCILMLGINNYIYYSGSFIKYLPLIQKITFVFVLAWVMGLNIKMIKANKS